MKRKLIVWEWFVCHRIGCEFAAEGWTAEEVEAWMLAASTGPQTRRMIRRAYRQQLARG
jgi:hypothetical protein